MGSSTARSRFGSKKTSIIIYLFLNPTIVLVHPLYNSQFIILSYLTLQKGYILTEKKTYKTTYLEF